MSETGQTGSSGNPAEPGKGRIQWIGRSLYDEVLTKAEESPRRRMNHNFHESMDDSVHRFLNVMLHGTYIQPHRHLFPPKPESFMVIEGSIVFIIFNDDGTIRQAKRLQAGEGIDIDPGIWHTLIVDEDKAVCFEVKPGPYRKADDKEFAPWAPKEGEEGVSGFLSDLYQKTGYQLKA